MKDKNNIGSKKIRNEVMLEKMMEKMMEKSGQIIYKPEDLFLSFATVMLSFTAS